MITTRNDVENSEVSEDIQIVHRIYCIARIVRRIILYSHKSVTSQCIKQQIKVV